MRIIVHRGTQQIGGSIIELATENTRIILDIGEELPKIDTENVHTVSDFPSVEGLFDESNNRIDAIFISHAHGDHVGLFPFINKQIPIFIGEKSCDIYNMTQKFIGSKTFIHAQGFLQHNTPIIVGDFTIIPYLVDHSAYDSYALVIHAEGKSVVYSGDIREHGKKGKLLQFFLNSLPKEVDALLLEGTMLGRMDEKLQTEEQIQEEAAELMSVHQKPVFVFQSSTNIDRIVAMYNVAKKCNRTFVIDVFTAAILQSIGGSVGNILRKARVIYPYALTKTMFQSGERELMYSFAHRKIKIEELNQNLNYCMIVRSSMLSLIQNLEGLTEGLFIYSMWKGYMENPRVTKMLDLIAERGMKRFYLHTSGHGGVQTLQKIATRCKSKKMIPIHTEHSSKYTELFENVASIHDGETFCV